MREAFSVMSVHPGLTVFLSIISLFALNDILSAIVTIFNRRK